MLKDRGGQWKRKGGEGDRYYGGLKDTELTPQPFRLKRESKCCCLSPNINQQPAWRGQATTPHTSLYDASLNGDRTLNYVKTKAWRRQLKLMSLVREEATAKGMPRRVLRQTLWYSVMFIRSSKFRFSALQALKYEGLNKRRVLHRKHLISKSGQW